MKTEMSPIATIAIIAVVVLAIGAWGWKQLQPAPYVPSPGVGGTPAVSAGTPGMPNGQPNPMPPAGATPGIPPQSH